MRKFSNGRMDGQTEEDDFSDYIVRPTTSVQECAMKQENKTGTPVPFYKTWSIKQKRLVNHYQHAKN